MSITTEIERIQADRNTIRAKLVELGLVTSTAKLDALATAIEGLINCGAVSVEVLEGQTYTIPRGFHNGSGVIRAMTDVEGEAQKYKTQAKTVTPTKAQQSITPDSGYYALESVTVNAIPDAYQDVTDVTAKAADVIAGRVFVAADGTVVVGTMPNIGSANATLSVNSKTYTIPKGYHNGDGKITITVETKSVTPTKSTQTVTPTSGKVLSQVTVEPIPADYQDITGVTATDATVLNGYKFVDAEGATVTGAMPNKGAANATLSPALSSYTIPAGYHNGQGKITLTLETKTATPSKSQQTVEATTGKTLSKVTVNPIPDAYQDITGVTATVGTVLTGSKFVASDGTTKEGTMVNRGSANYSIDGMTATSCTIPAGYHNGSGKISLTSSVEEALAAI